MQGNEKDLKIVFVTAGLPDMTLGKLADFAKSNGFQGLDLACWPDYMIGGRYVASHLNLNRLISNAETVIETQELIKAHKLEISALTFNDNLLDENPTKRASYHENLRKMINAAHLLKIGVVVTFVGRDFSKSIEENVNEFRWTFPPLVEFAKEHEVKIAIEHCPMEGWQQNECQINNICHSPRMWRLLSSLLPEKDRDHFGLCLDPSHLVWQGIDYIRAVYEFKDKLFHVHAKDVEIHDENLFLDGNLGKFVDIPNPWSKVSRYIARLPGWGEIRWDKFINALRDINYQGAISIEPEDPRFEKFGDQALNQNLVLEGLKITQKFLAPLCYKNYNSKGEYVYNGGNE